MLFKSTRNHFTQFTISLAMAELNPWECSYHTLVSLSKTKPLIKINGHSWSHNSLELHYHALRLKTELRRDRVEVRWDTSVWSTDTIHQTQTSNRFVICSLIPTLTFSTWLERFWLHHQMKDPNWNKICLITSSQPFLSLLSHLLNINIFVGISWPQQISGLVVCIQILLTTQILPLVLKIGNSACKTIQTSRIMEKDLRLLIVNIWIIDLLCLSE